MVFSTDRAIFRLGMNWFLIVLACGCAHSELADSKNRDYVFLSRVNQEVQCKTADKVQIVRCARMRGQDIRMAVIIRKLPRFGAFDRVYHPMRVEDPVRFIGEGQKELFLPVSTEVVGHILLIRNIGGDWRFMELPGLQPEKTRELIVPPVHSLPLLSTHREQQRLLEVLQVGRQEIRRMQEKER